MEEVDWQKFHVGQRVICRGPAADATPDPPSHKHLAKPKVGEIYTIRELTIASTGAPCCYLEEIRNPKIMFQGHLIEPMMRLAMFEPLKEESIEIFRKMCRDAENKEKVK